MTKLKQSEAVVKAVREVCAEHGIAFEGDMGPKLSKELRQSVYSILFEGFMNGSIQYSKALDEASVKKYIPGLVNNWLRKGKALNGGVAYVVRNPGSRTGSGDEQLKALRALQKRYETGSDDFMEIQSFIDARLAELGATKKANTAKPINVEALPEALRAKLSSN